MKLSLNQRLVKRQKVKGLCTIPYCSRKPVLGLLRCAHHRELHNAAVRHSERKGRAFKRLIGLCIVCGCQERAEGAQRSLCPRHRDYHVAAQTKYREKAKKARGWKMVKVRI